jgi:hypothetical protein
MTGEHGAAGLVGPLLQPDRTSYAGEQGPKQLPSTAKST